MSESDDSLTRLRKAELGRVRQRIRLEGALRGSGLRSVTREPCGVASQRIAVGHASSFYDPAANIAQAIRGALDPEQPPPRRSARRRREKRELQWVFRPDGRLNTDRYHGWDADEVAEVNPGFLVFVGSLSVATPEDKSAIRLALLRAAMKRRSMRQGNQ